MTPRDTSQRTRFGWLRVLLSGSALFVVATVVLFATGNPTLFPTVLLLGNFLIPVVFVSFLYDRRQVSGLSVPSVAQAFLIGGLLGLLGAAVLEPALLPPSGPEQGLSLSAAFLVGIIEEGSKIAAVAFLVRWARHNVAIDGLLLGGAVGMGFAALESNGYAFNAFVQSGGQVSAAVFSTVLRSFLAPFGHGVWTAILAAVLFREGTATHFRVNAAVGWTFLLVAGLHGLWDGLPQGFALIVPPGVPIPISLLVISSVGVLILWRLYRQAARQLPERLAQSDPRP